MTNQIARQPHPAVLAITDRLGCLLSILKRMVMVNETIEETTKREMVALLDSTIIGFVQLQNISASLIDTNVLSNILADLEAKAKAAIAEKEDPHAKINRDIADGFAEQKASGEDLLKNLPKLVAEWSKENNGLSEDADLDEMLSFSNLIECFKAIPDHLKNIIIDPDRFTPEKSKERADRTGYYYDGRQFVLQLNSFVLVYEHEEDQYRLDWICAFQEEEGSHGLQPKIYKAGNMTDELLLRQLKVDLQKFYRFELPL